LGAFPTSSGSQPKAYLNWILFDSDFVVVNAGTHFDQVGSSVVKEHLQSGNITVPSSGYFYVYVSNESTQDVYFDDVRLEHTRGQILQEDHYYPFGLNISALSSTAPLSKPNRFKYQGQEYESDFGVNIHSFEWRGYDQTLGRTWQLDPHLESYFTISPYSWAANDPISVIDPDGRDVIHFAGGTNYTGDDAVRFAMQIQGSGGCPPSDPDCGSKPDPFSLDIRNALNVKFAPSGTKYDPQSTGGDSWVDNTVGWIADNAHQIGVTVGAGLNAYAGFQEVRAGAAMLLAPTGITQVTGVYSIVDGIVRMVSAPIQISGTWTDNTSLENAPGNFLGLVGFLIDGGITGQWTTGGTAQTWMGLGGDFGLSRAKLIEAVSKELKDPNTLKRLGQIGYVGWHIVKPYKDAYKKLKK